MFHNKNANLSVVLPVNKGIRKNRHCPSTQASSSRRSELRISGDELYDTPKLIDKSRGDER